MRMCTMGQNCVSRPLRIAARMESPPFHPGRKNMTLRSALLLGGVILTAAVPVWADSISFTGVSIESANTESPVKPTQSAHVKMIAPMKSGLMPQHALPVASGWVAAAPYASLEEDAPDAEMSADAAVSSGLEFSAPYSDGLASDATPPEMMSIATFATSGAVNGSGSIFFSIPGALFGSSLDTNTRSSSLSDSNSHARDSSVFNSVEARRGVGHGREKRSDSKDQGPNDLVLVLVPEPGVLSLLLLGFAAVGILARRRSDLPATA